MHQHNYIHLKIIASTTLFFPLFLLFVYARRNAGDVIIMYINSLMSIFSKPVFKTLFHDFTYIIRQNQIDFIFYIKHSYEKGVLKSFAKFGKHLCWSHLFNKIAGWNHPTLLKRNPATSVVL